MDALSVEMIAQSPGKKQATAKADARAFFIAWALSVLLGACQSTSQQTSAAKERSSIDEHERKSLQMLYARHPEAKAEIEAAAGHAVFDVTAFNAVLLVAQEGKGVLVEHGSRKRTYMTTYRGGTGPGVGYQVMARIIALKSETAVSQFKLGGKVGVDFGVQGTLGTDNTERSANSAIKFWDIDEQGFAVEGYWGTTTYVVDQELNDPSTF